MWKMESAFEADDFLSLEEEENCTTYLLRFLMEHYKLPTAIWKLLDEKIHIVQNAGAFREHFPAQFVSYMVHKCESGEEVDFPSSVVRKMRITISFCNIMTELIRRCRRKITGSGADDRMWGCSGDYPPCYGDLPCVPL